jgi:hypothetical protein
MNSKGKISGRQKRDAHRRVRPDEAFDLRMCEGSAARGEAEVLASVPPGSCLQLSLSLTAARSHGAWLQRSGLAIQILPVRYRTPLVSREEAIRKAREHFLASPSPIHHDFHYILPGWQGDGPLYWSFSVTLFRSGEALEQAPWIHIDTLDGTAWTQPQLDHWRRLGQIGPLGSKVDSSFVSGRITVRDGGRILLGDAPGLAAHPPPPQQPVSQGPGQWPHWSQICPPQHWPQSRMSLGRHSPQSWGQVQSVSPLLQMPSPQPGQSLGQVAVLSPQSQAPSGQDGAHWLQSGCPQSPGQVQGVSPQSQAPLPQEGPHWLQAGGPQSWGQVQAVSPQAASQAPSPHFWPH